MARYEEACASAEQLGETGVAREDHILAETLGDRANSLVPDEQVAECVAVIVRPRHEEETAELLAHHSDERLEKLKPVVEKILVIALLTLY